MENTAEMWRRQPMYTFQEAAILAGVAQQTVRNWFLGRKSRGAVKVSPLFSDGVGRNSMISFVQLIETVIAAQFRNADSVPYKTVHSAYHYARSTLGVEYPFAHIKLEALGGHIVARREDEQIGESLQAFDLPPQWTIPGLVVDVIHQIDYEEDLAARWFPVGKDSPIVIDPRISSGLPTIVGRGVTIQAICKRKAAGQDIDFIARDLALKSEVVETVLHYGDRFAA